MNIISLNPNPPKPAVCDECKQDKYLYNVNIIPKDHGCCGNGAHWRWICYDCWRTAK